MKYLFVILPLVIFSCKKDRSCETCPPPTDEFNATVLYTGPVAGDGCDWVIKIDNAQYHPVSLSDDFKQNDLNVKVRFKLRTEHFGCGFGGSGIPIIEILSIKK